MKKTSQQKNSPKTIRPKPSSRAQGTSNTTKNDNNNNVNNNASIASSLNTNDVIPCDDDLYDAGWAKHYDAERKAYYYYPIDENTAETTWENPLTNVMQGSGMQSLTLSQMFKENQMSMNDKIMLQARGEPLSSDDDEGENDSTPPSSHQHPIGDSRLTTSGLSNSNSNNSASNLQGEQSLGKMGGSTTSLTLAALVGGSKHTTDQMTMNDSSSQSKGTKTVEHDAETTTATNISFRNNRSFAATSANAIPSDDDLYDAGWAKAFDADRSAYYYYGIDDNAGVATTWENPLAGTQFNTSLHQSGLLQQGAVAGNEANGGASFALGGSGTSLTLAALMAGGSKSNVRLDASQTIREDESFHDDEDDNKQKRDFQKSIPMNLNSQYFYSQQQQQRQEEFEDEHDDDDDRYPRTTRGGTDRKPLRMPRDKTEEERLREREKKLACLPKLSETKALVEKRRHDYLELFQDDYQKYEYKPMGLLACCFLCIVIATGLGVGGYFLVKSLEEEPTEWVPGSGGSSTAAPTVEPFTVDDLPDYTQEALSNPISDQATALNWLLDDPNFENYSVDEKLKRFALQTIYASTGGSAWGRTDGFVLPNSAYEMSSECEFPYYICPGPDVNNGIYGTVAPDNITRPPTSTRPPVELDIDTTPTSSPTRIVTNSTDPPTETNATPVTFPSLPDASDTDTTNNNNNVESNQTQRLLFTGAFGNGATLNLTNQGLLQGTLPPEIGLLTGLQHVHAAKNPGLIGSIPKSIRNWEDFLFSLELPENALTGSMPTGIGQLRHVRTLHLNDNKLTGRIPSSLSLLSQLTSLQLQNNLLSGTLPPEVASYPYVHIANMANNRITGPLPTFFHPRSLASQVREIILNTNSFTGTIPSELGGLTNLEVLRLHDNPNLQAQSVVPTELCDLMTNKKLRVLSVDCLNIICPCPQCECPTGGTPRIDNLITILPNYTVEAIVNSPPEGSRNRTAQAQAYSWLQADPAVNTYSIEKQQQRFALATLYFETTQPPNFTGWDTFDKWITYDEGNECDWQQTAGTLARKNDSATDNLAPCFETTTPTLAGAVSIFDAFQSLRLPSNSLNGTIPPEIAELIHLRVLELHDNNLQGSIPVYINRMTALEILDLENTGMTGTFPTELAQLPLLRQLYLAQNALNGTLPTEIALMTTLETLQLSLNEFTGTLITELGLLSNSLDRLYLTGNGLAGAFPVETFRQLTNLEELYLDSNELIGNLNDFPYQEIRNLSHLVLSDNLFVGTLSTIIGEIPGLSVLALEKNQIEGTIPSEIAKLSNTLQILRLSGNLFTGEIPSDMGLLTELIEFRADFAQLRGSLPPDIALARQLRSLSLSTNRLTDTIPPEIGFMPRLTRLNLDHNDFRGQLPVALGFLSNSLTWLDCSWNALTGTIPTDLAFLKKLEWLYLERNNMDGTVPTELGSVPQLRELSIYGQRLSGTIPTELGLLTQAEGIFLHENFLDGTIPSELGLLTRLTSMWLHILGLTGTVPSELCDRLLNGTLKTLAIDCTKVACDCGCSCPTEGGDAPTSGRFEEV